MTPIPAGWKLVPIEPTDEMETAAENDYEQRGETFPDWKAKYRAMLAAAPGAPSASAQPARDWELSCNECNGSGHVFVKHQVAERKTDVQEFKEECERCEGRGFVFAFEDIPGIAQYVKSCRPASVAPGDAQDERQAFEAWFTRNDNTKDMADRAVRRDAHGEYYLMQTYTAWEIWRAARASVAAPAAGDALYAQRYRKLRRKVCIAGGQFHILNLAPTYVAPDAAVELDSALDAALAAQVPHKGDAA